MSSYVISAAERSGVYRHIRISSEATLLDLHKAVVKAYEVEEFRRPSFTPQSRGKGDKAVKYSTSNTKTTTAMRDVRLKDAGFAARGTLIYKLSDPGLTFRCRTLEILEEPTPEPQVVRASGSSYAFRLSMGRLFKTFNECLAAEKEMRAAFGVAELSLETEDTLEMYFLAASNLYGLVPLETVYRLYARDHQEPDLKGFAVFGIMFSRQDQTRFYVLDKQGRELDRKTFDWSQAKYVAEYSVHEGGFFDFMLRMQKGKPFYLPGEEEFLRYAEEEYKEENEHFLRLRSFLKDHGLIPKMVKSCMDELVDSARLPAEDPDEFFEILSDYKVRMKDPGAASQALNLFSQMSDSTRSLFNCGHTPNEIDALTGGKSGRKRTGTFAPEPPGWEERFDPSKEYVIPPQLPYVAPPKPGRNEPCPCGSGKKYKHCCGKPGSESGMQG